MSNDGPWYMLERDGSIEYLKVHDGFSSSPLFKGYDFFEKLKTAGRLKPGSGIRVVGFNSMGFDESYWVNADYMLEGITGTMFAGKEGIHEPEEIIKSSTLWELLE